MKTKKKYFVFDDDGVYETFESKQDAETFMEQNSDIEFLVIHGTECLYHVNTKPRVEIVDE